MSSKLKTSGLLFSFVLCVYFLRNSELSPGSFVKSQVGRFLQDQQLMERFCSGVPASDTITDSQRNHADGYRNSLNSIRNDDKTLTGLIEHDEPNDDFVSTYVKGLIPILVPWLVFFVVGFLLFTVFLINFCCIHCKCCRNCACRCCLPPKTGRFKNCLATFSLVFMALAVGASVAGIIFSVNIPKEANATVCWTIRLLEKINEGSTEDGWIGLNPGINKLDQVVNGINQASSGVGVFSTIINNATSKIDQASNLADQVYTNNQNIAVDRVDPDQGTYVPDYIANLGPSSNESTITGSIQVEFDFKKQAVSGLGTTVDTLVGTVQSNAQSIVNTITDTTPTVTQVSSDISTIEDDISEHQDTIKTIIDVVGGVLLGLFIANASLAGLAFAAIVLVCCGAKAFNKAVTASWCTIGLLMLVGWLVSTAIFGITIFAFESCDAGHKTVQNATFFNQTFDKLASVFNIDDSNFEETRGVLYRCMHGDGDIAAEFNLRQNVVIIDDIITIVNQNYDLATQALGLIPASVVIPTTKSMLTQISEGTTPDSQDTVDDLQKLNTFTRSGSNPCTNVNDTWVFNSNTCDSSLGTEFTSTSPDTFNLDSPTCIGFDSWKAASDDISGRYTSSSFPQPSCGLVDGEDMHLYLQGYITNLGNNREQTQTVIAALLEELNNVNSANTQFMTQLNKIPTSIKSLNTTVASISNMLTGTDGLITNSNCRFVRTDFVTLLDVTCSGISATLYKITITYLVLAFVTLMGTIFLFCLSKRFTIRSGKAKQIEVYKQVEIKGFNPSAQSQYP